MPALSGSDVTNLRAGNHEPRAYLSIADAGTLSTAEITAVNSERLKSLITVTNTSALWAQNLPGMTLWIGSAAGAKDIGVYRLATPSASIITIAPISDGDPGLLGKSSLASISAGQYITVKVDFTLWYRPNRITVSGGTPTFYKDGIVAWNNSTSTLMPRPWNIGPHIADFVDDSSGVLEVTFDNPNDTIFNETLSDIAWFIYSDGSVTSGFTYTNGSSTQVDPTIEFDPGQYWVICRCFFGSGNGPYYYYRFVHAAEKTGANAPLSIINESVTDRQAITGRSMSFQTVEDVTNDFPSGTLAVVWEKTTWNGSDITAAASNYAGFISRKAKTHEPLYTENRIDLVSGLQLLAEQHSVSDAIVKATTPTNWTEGGVYLMTISGALFYRLYWHSTLCHLFDCDLTDFTSTDIPAVTTPQSDLPTQAQEIASRIPGFVGQTSDGTITLRMRPAIMNASERSGNVTTMTMTADDFQNLNLQVPTRPQAAQVQATAFAYNGTTNVPLASQAPGTYAATQGSRFIRLDGLNVDGQTTLNERVGNAYAEAMNPYVNLTATLAGWYTVFQPALAEFVALTTTDIPDWYENASPTIVIKEVRRNWEDVSVDITFDVLSLGYNVPGETVDVPTNDDFGSTDDGELTIGIDPYLEPPIISVPSDPGDTVSDELLAFTADNIYTGDDKEASSPTWTSRHAPDANYDIRDVLALPNSPYVGSLAGALNLVVVSYSSTDATGRIKLISDALDTSPTTEDDDVNGADLTLIRPVLGVAGASMAFGYSDAGAIPPDSTDWSYYFDFTEDQHGFAAAEGGMSWVDTLGWQGTNNYFNGSVLRISRDMDDDADFVVTRIIIYHTIYTPWDSETPLFVIENQTAGGDLTVFSGSDFAGTETDSGVISETFNYTSGYTRLIDANLRDRITVPAKTPLIISAIYIQGTGDDPFAADDMSVDPNVGTPSVSLSYRAADGTVTTVTDDADGSYVCGDVDDFNLGVALVGNGENIWYTDSYGGALTAPSGLTTTSLVVNCIRIPYRKLANTSQLNNDDTSLEFVICFDDVDAGGDTILHCSINASTGAITEIAELTPNISTKDYAVIEHPHALEMAASNPRVMRALATDVTTPSSTVTLIESDDGGATWASAGAADMSTVYHDSTSSVWLAGADGVAEYDTSSINDRDGTGTTGTILGVRTLA